MLCGKFIALNKYIRNKSLRINNLFKHPQKVWKNKLSSKKVKEKYDIVYKLINQVCTRKKIDSMNHSMDIKFK